MIINTNNLNQARKEIQILKKQKEQVIVKAQDEDFNRKILENPDVNIFLSSEIHDRKDFQKQRDSGLNEFLCKLAKKNNIKIAIDLDEIQKLNKKEKAKILSRIMQNIMLCKKTKTDMILYPKDKLKKQDIMAFFITLKSSSSIAKKAVQ